MSIVADDSIWSYGLEGPALEIAKIDASPLRICAGPGTGKTFALMQRVKRLIQGGTYPERIFVVTFTRTAARDLATSLRKLGTPDADKVRIARFIATTSKLSSAMRSLRPRGGLPDR